MIQIPFITIHYYFSRKHFWFTFGLGPYNQNRFQIPLVWFYVSKIKKLNFKFKFRFPRYITEKEFNKLLMNCEKFKI